MNYVMTEDNQIAMEVGFIRTMCISKWYSLSKFETPSEESNFSCVSLNIGVSLLQFPQLFTKENSILLLPKGSLL